MHAPGLRVDQSFDERIPDGQVTFGMVLNHFDKRPMRLFFPQTGKKKRRGAQQKGSVAMKPCIGYVRVSTGKQVDVSPDAQTDRIRQWANSSGHFVEAVYQDIAISGKDTKNRPEFQKALAHACKLKCPLVSYSLSRWSRSVKDVVITGEKLSKSGGHLVSITEAFDTTTAAGKMLFHVLAALAQFWRDSTSETTRNSLAFLRNSGKQHSHIPPYGFEYLNGIRQLNPHEQEVIKAIRRLSLANSPKRIKEILDNDGTTSRNGKPFSVKVICSILKRKD